MVDFRNLPAPIWRALKFPRFLFKLGLGPNFVLLLTSIGRKSGLPRVTPLQYEEENDIFYVASARGRKADWYRNVVANSNVTIKIKKSHPIQCQAFPRDSPDQIADFLALRLKNHPRMVSAMLRAEGLSKKPTRTELMQLADKIVLVVIERNKSIR